MPLPGPVALGRGVVVAQAADIPSPWRSADVILVGEAALAEPVEVISALRRAWVGRVPVAVVVEVDPLRFRLPPTHVGPAWAVEPELLLAHEELQFLVWANSYDARADPADPVWWWARKACRVGARRSGDGEAGDVVVEGLGPVWVDGGPRRPFGDDDVGGLGVVHRESVERGRLTPSPDRVPGADLAADQLRAVAHRGGAARIIAPAGSGKTRVLTERLRHLVVDLGWERDAVLAVAYNKKAQEELDARCLGVGAQTRTLNSLGLWVLGQARRRPPRVLGEVDVRHLVDRLAPRRRHRANTDPIGPYLEALGRVRLALVDPDQVEAERDDVPGLGDVLTGLRRAMADADAVDFDEQIYGAVEILLADGELRTRLQMSCRHLLVDEFQDLTAAHLLLVRLLAGPSGDVFGVGDDDQVLYSHAGADPGFLIHYAALFPGAGDHPLEVNYRCPPEVVDAAAHLLSYNDRRVPKVIRSGRREATRPGAGVTVGPGSTSGVPAGLDVRRHHPSEGAAAAAAAVAAWVVEGVAPADMAVLARVRAALLAPVMALGAAGVPTASNLGVEILERTGLRAALAYLRLASGADGSLDSSDVNEILRRPSRGLPPWFSDRVRRRRAWSTAELASVAASVPDKDRPKVERLVQDLVDLRGVASSSGATTATILCSVRDDVGLGGAMGLLDGGRGGEGSSHLDDLDALVEVAALHTDPAGFEGWLRAGLGRPSEAGGVTLSTVHRVKGMEWDRVVVYGVTAGLLPHRLSDDVEEERRIFHVALTRARQVAVVLADDERPSPFLAELDGSASRQATAEAVAGEGRAAVSRSAPAPRRGGPAGSAPAGMVASVRGGSRAAAPRTVEGRVGLHLVAAGGVAGVVAGVDDEGIRLGLDSGASLRVRFGEAVTLRGRDLILVAPPDLPPDVAAAEAALRAWRTSRARADKVSAFIVCSDRTLRAVAAARPSSLMALRQIEGIGPTKLEAYGEEILAVVADGMAATATAAAAGSSTPAAGSAGGDDRPGR